MPTTTEDNTFELNRIVIDCSRTGCTHDTHKMSFSFDRWDGLCWYTRSLKYLRYQKSVGVKSGNLRSHGNLLSSSVPIASNLRTSFLWGLFQSWRSSEVGIHAKQCSIIPGSYEVITPTKHLLHRHHPYSYTRFTMMNWY